MGFLYVIIACASTINWKVWSLQLLSYIRFKYRLQILSADICFIYQQIRGLRTSPELSTGKWGRHNSLFLGLQTGDRIFPDVEIILEFYT